MFHLEQFVTLLEYDPKVGALRVGERGGLMRGCRWRKRTIRWCFRRYVMGGSCAVVCSTRTSIKRNTIFSNVPLLPRAHRGLHAAHTRSVSSI